MRHRVLPADSRRPPPLLPPWPSPHRLRRRGAEAGGLVPLLWGAGGVCLDFVPGGFRHGHCHSLPPPSSQDGGVECFEKVPQLADGEALGD